jgi:O-antigen/teichoic acid export membrane protein
VNRLFARLGVHRREHVSVARDFSFSSANSVSLVLLLSTGLLLRRYLGPYLTGIWVGLELLPTYVGTYGHLGALTAAERELPFLIGANREAEFERLKDTLFWFTHGVGFLLAAGLIAAAFIRRPHIHPQTFTGMLLYAPILWAQLAATYYVVLYRARKRFGALTLRQGTTNAIKAVLLVAGALSFGLPGVLAVELAGALLLVVVLHLGIREPFARVFDAALLPRLIADGVPMVAGAVAFETLRGADQFVILGTMGATMLGVYSIAWPVYSGLFYIPNVLSTVMYPRFQERYGATADAHSLRRFVEVPLDVLADTLLALIAALLVALPPAIVAWFPQYVAGIPSLRVMLVGTYFLCLTPPAGQLLLTLRKQVQALFIGLPATALAFAAGYAGSRYGLVGVASGVSVAFFAEFVAINAYAFSHFCGAGAIAARLARLTGTAIAVALAAVAVSRFVPAGPPLIAWFGGWQLLVIIVGTLPLLWRAARRIRALQTPDSVDNTSDGH